MANNSVTPKVKREQIGLPAPLRDRSDVSLRRIDEVDLQTLDRLLNVVSKRSQRLFLDGCLGLMLIAGNEFASITLGDKAQQTINLPKRLRIRGIGGGRAILIRDGWRLEVCPKHSASWLPSCKGSSTMLDIA